MKCLKFTKHGYLRPFGNEGDFMCPLISMGIEGFGGLKGLIRLRQTKLGYFLIAGVNTHSLVFTRHVYLRPFGNEK